MTTLVDIANASGRSFTTTLTRAEQREMGQFMTPPTIARFMAERLVAGPSQYHVRVLEPAAGGGILAAAVVEALLAKAPADRPGRIELMLYELDTRLIPNLRDLCLLMSQSSVLAGVEFDFVIENVDFLMSPLALSGEQLPGLVTISNPPFLKLNKTTDARARLHAYAVHGQPNIYALFMAATARLTAPGGRWCFITPRSWMAGEYFKAARHTLLRHLNIDSLHAFESRTEGFEEDAVLQETVIAWASGRATVEHGANIMVTRSQGGADLATAGVQALPVERVVGDDEHAMFSLPRDATNPFEGWTATLKTHGFEVSTGRVVAFRASEYIREYSGVGTVPLLWLQHVRQQQILWPVQKKREHILASAQSAWMLVPNAPMVVMRRFSPKEDERRVTCAAYLGQLPGDAIGLENHLNYIYRPGGHMTPAEARGLAAFLASSVVDAHFRALAGSTQVNATELRKLPFPPLAVLVHIGEIVGDFPSLNRIDQVVNVALTAQRPIEEATTA
ncbi:N-6 DNA methylase [Duganella sp. FT135W]|uniref:site-specific DNA-methyltransferase (adenine-specific) n=1 Tax=Duganella flavida TaxID=2692175 RepID=A0A6L8KAH3_9BURK|nr:Eco57I restriction-modification methylase domain-containing protein [Duganella flavida]MYM23258.1 N-6 DNA methylase [Duganella flavida]